MKKELHLDNKNEYLEVFDIGNKKIPQNLDNILKFKNK